jgi:hypothetical protein
MDVPVFSALVETRDRGDLHHDLLFDEFLFGELLELDGAVGVPLDVLLLFLVLLDLGFLVNGGYPGQELLELQFLLHHVRVEQVHVAGHVLVPVEVGALRLQVFGTALRPGYSMVSSTIRYGTLFLVSKQLISEWTILTI